jgi:hypothetical protein
MSTIPVKDWPGRAKATMMQPFPPRFAQTTPAPQDPRARTWIPSLKGMSSLTRTAAARIASGDPTYVPQEHTTPEYTNFGPTMDMGVPDWGEDGK